MATMVVTMACRIFVLLLLTSPAYVTQASVVQFHEEKTAGSPSASESNRVFVVYLGGISTATTNAHKDAHIEMLSGVLGSTQAAQGSILYSYTRSFNGFAAMFSESHAATLRELDSVVSVFPSQIKQPHTTWSWEYLGLSTTEGLWPKSGFGSSDVIVGLIDTGVWPESESFQDVGFGPIPSKWKGTCVTAEQFSPANCNRKLIGAKYYDKGLEAENFTFSGLEYKSPRDASGHGSHTSSTAAGRQVPGASFLGVANGTASGGVPSARVAMYKACFADFCTDADILAAFDDAIADGVDLLSVSLGGFSQVYQFDSIAIGSFHAVDKGIVVSCAAGNFGPALGTVVNVAPWIFTVGANEMNRTFIATVQLGNGEAYKGVAINTYRMNSSHPLVYGGDIPASTGGVIAPGADTCNPDSLDPVLAKGNIILCYQNLTGADEAVLAVGAVGIIIIGEPSIFPYILPATVVNSDQGDELLEYISSAISPQALIKPSKTSFNRSASPTMAYFSSVGPNPFTEGILKPDITAPGVDIIAAWSPVTPPTPFIDDYRTVNYNIISGTSMATPHVTGAAALVKSVHPDWSPAAIKSAIMTTATPLKDSIALNTGLATGSGQINPTRAADPGLVFNVSTTDYINFLCATGYTPAEVELVSGKTQACPPAPPTVLDLNYPSIVVVTDITGVARVNRTLTNVGAPAQYDVEIVSPKGVNVSVTPTSLWFTALNEEQSVTVNIEVLDSFPFIHYVFGSVVWADGTHSVRIPIGVGPPNQ